MIKYHGLSKHILIFILSLLISAIFVNFRYLDNTNKLINDIEIALLTRNRDPSPYIVIVGMSDDIKDRWMQHGYVDRTLLAHLLEDVSRQGPRAIVLDVSLDLPHERNEDAILRNVLHNIHVPLVVSAYPDPKDSDLVFEKNMVPEGDLGWATMVTSVENDMARGVSSSGIIDNQRFPSFERLLVTKLGYPSPPDRPTPIAWRGPSGGNHWPFETYSAWQLDALPEHALYQKIVLIGSIMSDRDRHKTPFIYRYGHDGATVPGVVLVAHVIDQYLENRQSPYVHGYFDILSNIISASIATILLKLRLATSWKIAILAAFPILVVSLTGFIYFIFQRSLNPVCLYGGFLTAFCLGWVFSRPARSN